MKSKRSKLKELKEKVWAECRRITRQTYQNEDYTWNCYTCDRIIDEPSKAHTGHFLPSSTCGAYLRYDLRNLRVQCYKCNINGGGQGAEFYRRMVIEKGKKYVDQLFIDKNKSIKADEIWYQGLLDKYKNL